MGTKYRKRYKKRTLKNKNKRRKSYRRGGGGNPDDMSGRVYGHVTDPVQVAATRY